MNGRRQILMQDDISGVPTGTDVQWRAHTNATVTIASNGTSASLALGGQTLIASILSGPSGAVFSTAAPNRTAQDPAPPTGSAGALDVDQPNVGVTVLVVDNPNGGSYSLQILFNPLWSDFSASSFITPANVSIDSWSLTSHD